MLKKNLFNLCSRASHLFPPGLIWLALLFFLVNSSCSGSTQATGNGMNPGTLAPEAAEGSEEPADAACAYFYFLWG
jgi:hypothetical protein